MENLYFSKFTHIVSKNEIFVYYHSLRMKPVFVTSIMKKYLDEFQNYSCIEDVEKNITDDNIKADFKNLIKTLIEVKILNSDITTDERVINYFRKTIGKPYIQIAYFILTDYCNFNCSYCFIKRDYEKNNYKQKHMSKDIALKSLDYYCNLIKLDEKRFNEKKTIIFYGGEPLLNFETIEFILTKINEYKAEQKLPQDLEISLITNGSLINKNILNVLKKNNVSISISIDGDEFSTNSSRIYENKKPVYSDIVKGINLCAENDNNYSLSVTLSEESISDFDKTINAIYSLNPKSIGFNMLLSDENFKVSDDYNEKVSNFIIKAFEKFREDGIFEDRMMRKVKSFVEAKIYPFDCGATGGNQIVIAPDGEVGICHGYLSERKYFVSNVKDFKFNPEINDEFLEWSKRTPLNMEECQNCIALGICGGGCPLNAMKNEGSIWKLDKRFCTHAKKTLEWLLWDLFEKIKNKSNH